jgi:hypothetical protein
MRPGTQIYARKSGRLKLPGTERSVLYRENKILFVEGKKETVSPMKVASVKQASMKITFWKQCSAEVMFQRNEISRNKEKTEPLNAASLYNKTKLRLKKTFPTIYSLVVLFNNVKRQYGGFFLFSHTEPTADLLANSSHGARSDTEHTA